MDLSSAGSIQNLQDGVEVEALIKCLGHRGAKPNLVTGDLNSGLVRAPFQGWLHELEGNLFSPYTHYAVSEKYE